MMLVSRSKKQRQGPILRAVLENEVRKESPSGAGTASLALHFHPTFAGRLRRNVPADAAPEFLFHQTLVSRPEMGCLFGVGVDFQEGWLGAGFEIIEVVRAGDADVFHVPQGGQSG